jgi:hypothetical protein
MALPQAGVGLSCLRLVRNASFAADVTDAAILTVPFKCRIVTMMGFMEAIGGTTDFTDVDLEVQNGTTVINTTAIAIVQASAIVTGSGAVGSPDTDALAALAENDVLHLDIDITGGSSPTGVGCGVDIWVARE